MDTGQYKTATDIPVAISNSPIMVRSLATLTHKVQSTASHIQSHDMVLGGERRIIVVARPHAKLPATLEERLSADRVKIISDELESIVYFLCSRLEVTSPGGVCNPGDLRVVGNLPPRISSASCEASTLQNIRRQSLMLTLYTLHNLVLIHSAAQKFQEGHRREWFWYWRNTTDSFSGRVHFTRQDGDVVIVDEYAHRVLGKLRDEIKRLEARERGLSMSEILSAVRRMHPISEECEEVGRMKGVGYGFVKDYRSRYPLTLEHY